MELEEEKILSAVNTWHPVSEAFLEWIEGKEEFLEPGLSPKPTVKVLIFLALLDATKPCSYDQFREIFRKKKVIQGTIPENTLRTSVLNLAKTLEKSGHDLELKSFRGRFQLIPRLLKTTIRPMDSLATPILNITDPPDIEKIAHILVEKATLSAQGLYFIESSARDWLIYSGRETEIRADYEAKAWEELGIRDRLSKSIAKHSLINIVSFATGEGLGEINLIKTILNDGVSRIHYLAIDASPRLLRDHLALIKETFSSEILNSRLVCTGAVADLFFGLRRAVEQSRFETRVQGHLMENEIFLPSNCAMLITYFGNCLGNSNENSQDQETRFFSMIHSVFEHRPLEILTGVSVMRPTPDEYIRTWDNFLLQTPRYLLETKKLLKSSHDENGEDLPEFHLPAGDNKKMRYLTVKPEPYIVRHQIEGQIYPFYYKLAFDLELSPSLNFNSKPLPKGTLIHLHSIIKYNMKTLANGIEKSGLFKVRYNPNYHQVVDTLNGKREYAVFSAYIEK